MATATSASTPAGSVLDEKRDGVPTSDRASEGNQKGGKELEGSIVTKDEPSRVDYPWSVKGPALCMVLLFNREFPEALLRGLVPSLHSLTVATYWFSSSLGPLKTTIKKELNIDNAQYGVIASSGSLVNTVVPFFR